MPQNAINLMALKLALTWEVVVLSGGALAGVEECAVPVRLSRDHSFPIPWHWRWHSLQTLQLDLRARGLS